MEATTQLERTLRERPDDDSAWGAYGTRLREQGDARGDLIRLEQRLGHLPPADRAALQSRIEELVAEHGKSWDAELPDGVSVPVRRHGFPVKVAVDWQEGAPALVEQALRGRFVTGLRIRSGEIEDDADDWYEDEDGFDEDGMPLPQPPLDVPGLAQLDLGDLTELDLAYFRVGDPGAEALAAASCAGRITTLDLRYTGLGDTGIAALAASPHFRAIRRLHLQHNQLTAEGVRALAGFAHLTELDLRYNRIGEEGARALAEAPFAPSLTRLLLHRSDVTAAGARVLAHAPHLPSALRSFWRSV
ncbi:hypothetical protein HUT18_19370 [Streptomyces sp. NA04227]|uniref:hypothetical protein n=1 Tax=Streptomyces sp. NA04227 TaxID=2742136 RepID=UPI0015912C42|nr:hypothetical protein [Streptomyces sp. NA04227]QKW08218.1 hypothetical protein HUT18_19370 [Streptomyces sp. NA04227]